VSVVQFTAATGLSKHTLRREIEAGRIQCKRLSKGNAAKCDRLAEALAKVGPSIRLAMEISRDSLISRIRFLAQRNAGDELPEEVALSWRQRCGDRSWHGDNDTLA
jgi:hypothetical protein